MTSPVTRAKQWYGQDAACWALVQFSLVQDGIYALSKARMRSSLTPHLSDVSPTLPLKQFQTGLNMYQTVSKTNKQTKQQQEDSLGMVKIIVTRILTEISCVRLRCVDLGRNQSQVTL